MRYLPRLLFLLLFVEMTPTVARSAPIVSGSATYEYLNTFTTRLFPGTPFNPGSEAVDLPIESTGLFRQVWQAQEGDRIADELTNIRQVGYLPGEPPVPFEIIGGIERTPNLGPFLGEIAAIEQNPLDPGFDTGEPSSLKSASRRVRGPFAQVLIDGTYLYSVDDYVFEGEISALPFPVGSQFIGTTDSNVEVRLRLGNQIDPVNDPVIGLVLGSGVVEITKVLPEPNSLLVFAIGATVFCSRQRRTYTRRRCALATRNTSPQQFEGNVQ